MEAKKRFVPYRRPLSRTDLKRMNLPERLWRAKLREVSDQARPTVERYLLQIEARIKQGIGLLLHGDRGVGKTAIGAVIAKEARSRLHPVYFISVWEMRELMLARTNFDDNHSIMSRCRAVDLLVLDDLRAEDFSKNFLPASELQELILFRGMRRKVTIVTVRAPGSQIMTMPFKPFLEAVSAVLVPYAVRGPNRYEAQKKSMRQSVVVPSPRTETRK